MDDEEAYPAPDWAHWRARDLWRLHQAVALSLGIEPSRVAGNSVQVPSIGPFISVRPLPADYFERLGIAQSCAGMSLAVRGGHPAGELVEPAKFAVWARGKGFVLPHELDRLAAEEAKKSANRRPQGSKLAQAAWQIAERILENEDRCPPRGYGRLIALAHLVNVELNRGHKDESVRKAIGPSVREWESSNPRR